jgi:hypothetical protein
MTRRRNLVAPVPPLAQPEPPAPAPPQRRRARTPQIPPPPPPAPPEEKPATGGRELQPGDRIPDIGIVLRVSQDPYRPNWQYLLVKWTAPALGTSKELVGLLCHDTTANEYNHHITRPWMLPKECFRDICEQGDL